MILLSLSFLAYANINNSTDLVEINKINPNIKLDIRYATPNNFTHQILYKSARCFLCREAALALNNVQQELEELGLGLLIWDGYRPLSTQKKMWAVVPDDRYVANPAKGSRHNRGCAVDCTIIKKDGTLLEMPSEFDDFSEKAHRSYMNLSQEAITNRTLLENIMAKHGFAGLPTEWWHFDFKEWQQHPILNVDFEDLAEKGR